MFNKKLRKTKKKNRKKIYQNKSKKIILKKTDSKNIDKEKYTTRNKVNLKKESCAPKAEHNFTCYSRDSLFKLRTFWNLKNPEKKIESNDVKVIWKDLKKYMNNTCDRESCWLKQEFIKSNLDSDLSTYTFAPRAPKSWIKNKKEWLSSLELIKVMKQYEKKNNNFLFLGPSPIDYDNKMLFGECVWEELCNFDLLTQIKNNKNKIGIIFNLDPHYKEGSHWVAGFIDLTNQTLYYFDSSGDDTMPRKISKFFTMVKKQGNKLKINFKLLKNEINHQRKESECGIYCLYFIIELINFITNKDDLPNIFKNRIKDDEMNNFRDIYFNIY